MPRVVSLLVRLSDKWIAYRLNDGVEVVDYDENPEALESPEMPRFYSPLEAIVVYGGSWVFPRFIVSGRK